jgi:hypothetical protein
MNIALIVTTLLSASAFAGGVSGGGGNLISPTAPLQMQDPRDIKDIILSSKNLLKKYIDVKHSQYTAGTMDNESLKKYSVLFANNENNLHEVMEEIALDVQLEQPCFDINGNVFDGSTFNQQKHSICISAATIAQKCNRPEVPLQATALVIHEYSEVVGLSDDDAISLQKQVIAELK